MPFDPELYPPDWPAISSRIRARAGNRCEWWASSGVTHNYETHPLTKSRVVAVTKGDATVAHLDQDRGNNSDENLACLCQRCHFEWDRPFNVAKVRRTRRRNRDRRRGQQPLWPW